MRRKRIEWDNFKLLNAVLVQGTSATITVVNTSLENEDGYKLRYCLKWTNATGAENLFITVNGTTYPVLTKFGNPVTIGRLRRRELLCLIFSNLTDTTTGTVPHFTLLNNLFCQAIVTPAIAPATA